MALIFLALIKVLPRVFLKSMRRPRIVAFYVVGQNVVDSGGLTNSVVATAGSPGQTNNVSDTSDDGDDTDGNIKDDETVLQITRTPLLEVTKTASVTDGGDGFASKNDVISIL